MRSWPSMPYVACQNQSSRCWRLFCHRPTKHKRSFAVSNGVCVCWGGGGRDWTNEREERAEESGGGGGGREGTRTDTHKTSIFLYDHCGSNLQQKPGQHISMTIAVTMLRTADMWNAHLPASSGTRTHTVTLTHTRGTHFTTFCDHCESNLLCTTKSGGTAGSPMIGVLGAVSEASLTVFCSVALA